MLSDQDLQERAPFELVKVHGSLAAETWQELRKREGVVPVLLGGRDSTTQVLEGIDRANWGAGSLLDTTSLDLQAWMDERVRGRPDYYGTQEIDAPWNGRPRPIMSFLPAHDHRGEPYPEVFFGLVPAGDPWRVPLYFGGEAWNECPAATVHAAFSRRWYEGYGAVITTFADAVIEFHVERPPTTLEAARVLAYEQFVYCPHIVYEGLGTLGNVAGALLNRPRWYFWWA